jgi:hypothetical protein
MDCSAATSIVTRNRLVERLAEADYSAAEEIVSSSSTLVGSDGTRFAGLSLEANLNVFRSGVVGPYNFAASFVCSVCRHQLVHPVIFLCGHAACRTCAARQVFARSKCDQCKMVCSLPRGYQTDVVLRVLEKQRPPCLARRDLVPSDAALDIILHVLSAWLGSCTLTAEAPRAVVQLASGARLQLQLALTPKKWALYTWFIYDAPHVTPLQMALSTTVAAQEAAEHPLLQQLHTTVTTHQAPQRLSVEVAFTADNTNADTARLHFHAVHTWATQQWQKVITGGH